MHYFILPVGSVAIFLSFLRAAGWLQRIIVYARALVFRWLTVCACVHVCGGICARRLIKPSKAMHHFNPECSKILGTRSKFSEEEDFGIPHKNGLVAL